MSTNTTKQFPTIGLFVLLSAMVLFHFLVLIQIIPYTVIWGGRITDNNQMVRFELISIVFNILMLGVVALHAGFINLPVRSGIIKGALWLMFVLFVLNTLGNITSRNDFEKWVFTPVTVILSICCLLLALNRKTAQR